MSETLSSEQLARVFRALSDPNRLAIFQLVREHGSSIETADQCDQSISEIASGFELSLSTVSHHLRELRLAGLVHCEREGQTVRCSVPPGALEQVERFLGGLRT